MSNDNHFDNTLAMREGWCITNGTNDSDDKWRLTKLDEMDMFSGDTKVWKFVCNLADQGSIYHKSALEYLESECNAEFNRIKTYINEEAI